MAGPSKRVTVRPLHPFSPNCPHMPTVASTIQLFAQAYDQNDLPINPGLTWSTTDAGVATVNGSGLVTGVANGICNIKATAVDNVAAVGQTSVGVALLSANSVHDRVRQQCNDLQRRRICNCQLGQWSAWSSPGLCWNTCHHARLSRARDASDGACTCFLFGRWNLLHGYCDRY